MPWGSTGLRNRHLDHRVGRGCPRRTDLGIRDAYGCCQSRSAGGWCMAGWEMQDGEILDFEHNTREGTAAGLTVVPYP